jgi:hypothetical protein
MPEDKAKEALTRAMKEAVKQGIFPKHGSMPECYKNWQQLEKVLTVAFKPE